MRLWSLHPSYLDSKGLVALWREGLLAQKVLQGKTKGYRNHPQLERFKSSSDALGAISTYLRVVVKEAENRGYNFDSGKIADEYSVNKMEVSSGQLQYELSHLLNKLKIRDRLLYDKYKELKQPVPHPLFKVVGGDVANWERR